MWLLDELNVSYEVKYYTRENFRAPESLKKVFPLGRSPIVEIVSETSGRKVLAETGHIFSYFLRHYDNDKKLTPTLEDEQELVDYYLHYSEGTLQGPMVSLLVNSVAKHTAPFGTKTLMGLLVNGINQGYYIPEITLNLKFLDDNLKDSSSGYLVGNKLSAADIILSFPLHESLFGPQSRADIVTNNKFSLKDKYPNIYKWSQLISREPGYIAANKFVEKEYHSSKM